MKHNVLHALRNAAKQLLSGNLAEAVRAIKESFKTQSPLQDSPDASLADSTADTPASDFSSAKLSPASQLVAEDQRARVESQPDSDQLPVTARPSAVVDEQFDSGEFVYAGASLDYRLYIPPVSTRDGSLLVMLHGCTQEAVDFSTGTAMNTLARDAGYTVLYPSQNSSANPNRCWNWFVPDHQQRGAGEPALLGALTQFICSQQALDPTRIFVAGLSAGGAMALILAEEFPDIFAGVGVHSGLATGLANNAPQAFRAMMSGGTPTPLAPTALYRPTIVIHGDQDKTVHPQNAEVIVERCLAQYRQQHSGEKPIYRCHEVTPEDHGDKRHEYRNHDGEMVCMHLQLSAVGHAWSGGDTRGSYTAAGGISSSEYLLRFFDGCPGLPAVIESPDLRAVD